MLVMKYMNPVNLLNEAKKKHDILNSILILVVSSVIFAVATSIGLSSISLLSSVMDLGIVSVAISVFGIVFIGGLFFGWIFFHPRRMKPDKLNRLWDMKDMTILLRTPLPGHARCILRLNRISRDNAPFVPWI